MTFLPALTRTMVVSRWSAPPQRRPRSTIRSSNCHRQNLRLMPREQISRFLRLVAPDALLRARFDLAAQAFKRGRLVLNCQIFQKGMGELT